LKKRTAPEFSLKESWDTSAQKTVGRKVVVEPTPDNAFTDDHSRERSLGSKKGDIDRTEPAFPKQKAPEVKFRI